MKVLRGLALCFGTLSIGVRAQSTNALGDACLEAIGLKGEIDKSRTVESQRDLLSRLVLNVEALDQLKKGDGLTAKDRNCLQDQMKLTDDLLRRARPEYRRNADYLYWTARWELRKGQREQGLRTLQAAT